MKKFWIRFAEVKSLVAGAVGVIVPAISSILVVATLAPMVYLTYTSFLSAKGFDRDMRFVRLQNYSALLSDRLFWQAAANTVLYSFTSVAGQILVGTLGALVLARASIAGRNRMYILLLVPYMITPSVIAVQLWRFLGDSQAGIFAALSGHTLRILSPDWIFLTMILVSIWIFSPFALAVLLTRRLRIPESQYEILRLDGAGSWRLFFHITLPQLLPTIASLSALRLVIMATKFDVPYLFLGSGYLLRENSLVSILIFERAYEAMDYGVAAAASVLLFIGLGAVALMMQSSLRRRF